MTNKEIYDKLNSLDCKMDKIFEKQVENEKQILKHEQAIKGIWKIPVISGGTVAIITAIGVFVATILK